ncbi:SusC/RagA family TonB-linked outer membrane protein [Hymenobacter lapidiphilus]|uniref:SusC/RagA family TonB-linked outer membrane protein n=1 Tax=Hymenobacter sp. CCM 8763 TaxID=2303334 RepID=UPI000E34CFEB|nr:SusC/RagA family TonB-linked outer membrane protein [Hymenobacter sp. CCM 8763]RFP65544.1 SusC/RagA family TonB-linked outer membrane protein [Hymenobacter sp. CCM 8763]
MRKILLTAALLAPVLLQQAAAQNRQISGRITDRSSGQGLPGVTVLVKGTTIGVSTNADGSYTISAPASATTLTFSSIGFVAVERPIGTASTIDIGLSTDSKVLGEVVVTALGQERTRNSLPFAATQIEGTQITAARNPNAVNGLSGKVAGIQIRQSNTLGGSTNILIRGTKSITGNNQPLFVVDGVPISNANTNTGGQQTGGGGYDYGNAAADINPDDIATMTILKGAAATALYGERAGAGVILITTKKGRQGLGVTINAGVTGGRIDKSTFVNYQKEYGSGYGPYFDMEDVDGDGRPDRISQLSADASNGPRFDPNLSVFQWDAFVPGTANFGKATPWVAAANDPTTFFETAVTLNNSIAIDGGNDKGTFKLGYSSIRDKGVLPNSQVNKNIVNFAGSLNLTTRLTASAAVNFSVVDGNGRYGTGYSGGFSENLVTNFRQWWPVNVDIKQQKQAYEATGANASWNIRNYTTSSPEYWNNPYFSREKSFQTDSRYRTFGNVSLNYKVTDWFDVLGRVTLDSNDELQEERLAFGSVGVPGYSRYNRTSREANFDLIGNFKAKIAESISFNGLIGANMRREQAQSIRATTNGGLVIPELYSLSNSVSPLIPPGESDTRRAVDGIFASTTFGYRDMVFLDLTARRDVSSTLASNNNAFFYPSAALGFVFSELVKETAPWMSYGKIRGNYAEVGLGAPIYSLNDSFDKPVAFGNVALFSVPSTKNNPDLLPERTKSGEIGVEMAFLNSRFGFEANVYQSNSVDQIIPINVSTASGFGFRFVNSGEVRNRGLELSTFLTPFRSEDFTWTINANWTKNQNRVMSLYEGFDNIVLANYQGGVSSNATVGRPFGSLRGSNFVYQNGQKVVGEDGYYLQSDTRNEEIGNPNPSWTGGVSNTVSYKGVSLYFLVDVRNGGQVFSLDRSYGLDTGVPKETAGLNDLGNPSRDPIVQNPDGTYASTSGGVIFPGVQENGSPNTVRADNSTESGSTAYGYSHNPSAAFVYDASYVKLRELSLSYSLPKAWIAKVGAVKGVDFSIVGRNLWILHKNMPDADPEDAVSSGNLGQGYSTGAYPAVRTLGANIRLSF